MTSTCAESPRILIADDQPDLLDALKTAAQGSGHRDRRRDLAGRGARGARDAPVRSRADGSQLHGRHDVGARRHRSAVARAGARPAAAGRRDDRLGQRGSRRRSHAPRRARLRAEAVGQRAAACDPAQRDRGRPRATPARRRRAARAGRGAEDPAAAAAAAGAADRRLGARGRRGSRPPASAATASTRSASATRASRCRSPTWSARASPRRC